MTDSGPEGLPPSDVWLAENRAWWDERAPAHATSPDYSFTRFAEDPGFISDVVRFDLPLLGDVAGLRGVHLQCHIGTDTVSLARLGARMTGVDFSAASVAQARRLARESGTPVDFVESTVDDAPLALGGQTFDFVFTGIGALCWLPSIARWADVVTALLKPGGRLFIREGHPMLWAVDERDESRLVVGYPYFETPTPLTLEEEGTYVETDLDFAVNRGHSWNRGLGEIVSALLERGFTITGLVEHASVPWEALTGRMTRGEDGEWTLHEGRERLPLSSTLQAVRSTGRSQPRA
jgi:SAM-dependent methyltransferase